ncbi:MAG: VCBS repeat-containing protein [Phycisphaerales bacterium]|nr:VCBS repeat-containing protein [Phycisphaerales bacterium]
MRALLHHGTPAQAALARAASARPPAASAPTPSPARAATLALLLAGGALLLAPLAAQTPAEPTVTTIQVPEKTTITDVLECDVDGDGLLDLVLATRDDAAEKPYAQVHLRAKAGAPFSAQPSRPPLPLERDVVAFTFADVLPAPGRECVLLTPERAVAATQADDGTPVYTPLGAIQLVWPTQVRATALLLDDACLDLDGDGLDDLLLPEPDGAVVLRPGKEPLRWSLPAWRVPTDLEGGNGAVSVRTDGSSPGVSLMVADGDAEEARNAGPLASASFRTPAMKRLDLDGDGAFELVAVRNDKVFVARVRDGALQQSALALPLPPDRLIAFDPDFDVQLADCNGDKKADLLLTTSARRGDEVEVRVDLFLAKADGTFGDKQDSRLRVQPLAGPPQLVDCDGDGVLDLALRTVKLDGLRGLTGDAPSSLETQLTIFHGAGDRFVQPAMLATVLQIAARQDAGQPYLRVLAGAPGQAGSVLLREDDQLQRRPLAADGRKLRLDPPDCALALQKGARLLPAADPKECHVRRAHELLHVRMP